MLSRLRFDFRLSSGRGHRTFFFFKKYKVRRRKKRNEHTHTHLINQSLLSLFSKLITALFNHFAVGSPQTKLQEYKKHSSHSQY